MSSNRSVHPLAPLATVTVLALAACASSPPLPSTPLVPTTPPPPRAEPRSEPTPPAAAAPRTIVLVSDPPGAEVRFGELELGTTPLTVVVPAEWERVFELRLRGYLDHRVPVPDESGDLRVSLATDPNPGPRPRPIPPTLFLGPPMPGSPTPPPRQPPPPAGGRQFQGWINDG